MPSFLGFPLCNNFRQSSLHAFRARTDPNYEKCQLAWYQQITCYATAKCGTFFHNSTGKLPLKSNADLDKRIRRLADRSGALHGYFEYMLTCGTFAVQEVFSRSCSNLPRMLSSSAPSPSFRSLRKIALPGPALCASRSHANHGGVTEY